ncbi:MAG TPA: MFS transporter [Opitutaceae bacterium]|nr:MFS transporter [Opitutaceae bacterium]
MNPPSPDPGACPAPTPTTTYRAGTLTYTAAGLRAIFIWLLAGEVIFTLIDMLEPKVLPVLLKLHGASDKEIGVIVGSFNAILQLIIMAPLGYYSDRLRTRWGRRIPVLFWATPFVTIFLAITPYAPELAAWLLRCNWSGPWLRSLPVAPVIFVFAALVLLYRSFQTVTNVMFFGLLRDVVPDTHMGRFLALFRVFGAGGTFIITYWLLGRVTTHSREIFIGVALLNLVGFSAICWFVREGTYPAVPPPPAGEARPAALGRAVQTFIAESYRHPVYLWVYFVRICLYGALLGLSGFIIFFPQYELGMDLDAVGRMLSWPALVWVVIAYPVGRLVDARGASHVLGVGLVVITLGYVLSFFLVVGPWTFLASSLVTGVAFWVVMMAQLKLTQEIFHPLRYSQLAGANTIVQSIIIAVLVSPGCGWILDALQGWHYTFSLPVAGQVVLGPYRLVNLMLGGLYGLAWFGLRQVKRHQLTHGGPDHYVAPL